MTSFQKWSCRSISANVLIAKINTYAVLHPLCLQINEYPEDKNLKKGVLYIRLNKSVMNQPQIIPNVKSSV